MGASKFRDGWATAPASVDEALPERAGGDASPVPEDRYANAAIRIAPTIHTRFAPPLTVFKETRPGPFGMPGPRRQARDVDRQAHRGFGQPLRARW